MGSLIASAVQLSGASLVMSQSVLRPFEIRLAEAWPPQAWRKVRVALAVSGGRDSVALARAMVSLATFAGARRQLWLIHFNHRLRGADADADEQFVRELADRLGVEIRAGHAQPGALCDQPDGLEAAAREARLAFFRETAEALGARYVATAHTADDQAETILHRIVRGTGLAGLAGIPRARLLTPAVTLLRPLLEISRSEIEAYLNELGQPWREDLSNQSRQFTRARIRYELLPLLAKEFNPDIKGALTRLGKLAAGAQAVVETQAEALLCRAISAAPARAGNDRELGGARRLCLNCAAIRGVERHLAREVFALAWRRQAWPLQNMGFAEWDELVELATEVHGEEDPDSVREFPGGVRVVRAGDEITLSEP